MPGAVPSSQWAADWQASWDRLEESLIPNREEKLHALVDVAEAVAGRDATVVDLACGTGSVTLRLLERMPATRSIAVDVDPVLLTIAAASFADDHRVRVLNADLRGERWLDAMPDEQVDAVLTATSLHWLSESVVRRLYGDLSRVVRSGGVFAHLEVMPLPELPRLGRAVANLTSDRHLREHPQSEDWTAWWETAAGDPLLRSVLPKRNEVFESTYPMEEFSPPADWHIRTLRDAGFSEAGVVWRSGSAAIVAAVR